MIAPVTGNDRAAALQDDNFAADAEGDYEGISSSSGGYTCKMEIPSDLHGNIVGKGRSTLQKLEKDTGATIAVPRKGDNSSTVIITGPTAAAVAAARTRVGIICDQGRSHTGYTHFLNIPLSGMAAATKAFQEGLYDVCGDAQGMSQELFVDPARVHITLVMLKLLTEEEVKKAGAVLKDSSESVISVLGGAKLGVSLDGVEIMNDDPSQVDVLYAKVDEP